MNNRLMITVFLIAGLSIIAQGQGMVFDQEAFDKGEQYESERADYIPQAFSLKKYAPYVLRQQYSTCVAYSTASALTIMQAVLRNDTDTKNISLEAISPHWIYYRNKGVTDRHCNEGLNLDKTMKDVLNNGATHLIFVEYPDFYPFGDTELCSYYPPDYEKDETYAFLNKPDEIFRIKEVNVMKIALSKGMPVVIGMNVPSSFEKAIGKSLWTPTIIETKFDGYGHAMVVVGYDDNKYGGAFELMNSWGEAWGNGGYIWVKYSDMEKFLLGGYGLYKEKKLKAGPPSKLLDKSSGTLLDDQKLSKENKKNSKGRNRYKDLGKRK